MLSIVAYDLLNVIVQDELAVQDVIAYLRAIPASTESDPRSVLRELVAGGFVQFRVHEDYGRGRQPPLHPTGAVVEFDRAWVQCFKDGAGPAGPTGFSGPTITVTDTEAGVRECHAKCYDAYMDELRRDFGWPSRP